MHDRNIPVNNCMQSRCTKQVAASPPLYVVVYTRQVAKVITLLYIQLYRQSARHAIKLRGFCCVLQIFNFYARWENKNNSRAAAVRVEANVLEGDNHCLCALLLQMHKMTMLDLENYGKSHVVQHAPYYHTMVIINLYKINMTHVCAISHRFRDINISDFLS